MNVVARFRKLRAVPERESWQVPPHPHSAGEERPALAVVPRVITYEQAKRLGEGPPPEPDPNPPMASLDDPSPIYDSVMESMHWETLPYTATLAHLNSDGTLHHTEKMPLTNPPVDIQFEVALALDVSDAAELQAGGEFDRRVVEEADHGWGWPK